MNESAEKLLTSIITLIITTGMIGVMYNVMKSQVDAVSEELKRATALFKTQIEELEKKLITAQANTDTWFRKFHMVSNIIEENACSDRPCNIHRAYRKFQAKEGKVKDEDKGDKREAK